MTHDLSGLHPVIAELLSRRPSVAAPALADLSVDEARAMASAMTPDIPSPPVGEVQDIEIEAGAPPLTIRHYAPEGGGPSPICVFLHGGGWVLHELEAHDAMVRALCRASGWRFVSVNYRRAPEHKFPALAEDCYTALCWTARNAGALGSDGTRLAICGDSAGGNLAAATALLSARRNGPALEAQILFYPALDPACESASFERYGEGYVLSKTDMKWFWAQYLRTPQDAEDGLACPFRAPDLHLMPRTLTITAEFDPLKDEGMLFAKTLSDNAVQSEAICVEGVTHGFASLPGLLEPADRSIDAAAAFLNETPAPDRPGAAR